jgi:hypothetical protein
MQPATFQMNSKTAIPMSFRVFSYSNGEPLDTVEMHVLAKAYRAAWRSLNASEPVGAHLIERLDVVLDFGGDGTTARSQGNGDASAFGPVRRTDWG